MLKPSPVVLKSGTIIYRVQYRLRPGAIPTSDRFETYRQALDFCALIDRVGPMAARQIRDASTMSAQADVITCADAFTQYVDHAASYAEEGTLMTYRGLWRRHIGETFDPWPVGQVTRHQVEQWVARLRTTETEPSARARAKNPKKLPDYLSTKTIANLHGLLSSVLSLQVERGVIDRNPAYRVRLPVKYNKREPMFLNTRQRVELLANTPREWQTFVALLMATGIRWGEATALTATDLDLEATPATVRIERAWKRDSNGFHLGPPKSKKSRRTITLPEQLIPDLTTIADQHPDGLLFEGPNGGRLRSEWFTYHVWNPATKAAHINPKPRIHDLRHTHASMLLGAGVPIHIIQYRMGHESIETTVNVYGHLTPEAGRIAAEATQLAMATALPQLIEPAS